MKTLCTIDSTDIALNDHMYRALVQKRYKLKSNNNKKHSIHVNSSPLKSQTFTTLNNSQTPKNIKYKHSFNEPKSRLKT